MKKAILLMLGSMLATTAFAQTSTVALKAGQSVVVCQADGTDSNKNKKDGLSALNRLLIQDEVSVNVAAAYGYDYSKVSVKAPFSVSAPTISTTKNKSSVMKDYDDTYTYCVTITKQ